MKMIQLGDILNEREIRYCTRLKDAKEICEKVTRPQLARINQATGQENDPLYLAYAIMAMIEVRTARGE